MLSTSSTVIQACCSNCKVGCWETWWKKSRVLPSLEITVTLLWILLPIKTINLWVVGGGGSANIEGCGDEIDGKREWDEVVVVMGEMVMVVPFSCLILLIFLMKSQQADCNSPLFNLMGKGDTIYFSWMYLNTFSAYSHGTSKNSIL